MKSKLKKFTGKIPNLYKPYWLDKEQEADSGSSLKRFGKKSKDVLDLCSKRECIQALFLDVVDSFREMFQRHDKNR